MLKHLHIKNFALIEEAKLDFKKGLTVITGETGAGKSIMLAALGLITGNRADLLAIGNKEEKCTVEAHFMLSKEHKSIFDEEDLDFEVDSIIRRELLPSGKSRAFINDTPVQLKVLKEITAHLVDIHSQQDNQLLLDPAYRIMLLDQLSENGLIKQDYQAIYAEYKEKLSLLKSKKSKANQLKEALDFKQFQLNELQSANLDNPSELEELEERQQLFEKSEEVNGTCKEILGLNEEPADVIALISGIANKLSKLSESIGSFEEMAEQAIDVEEKLRDLTFQASKILDSSDFDEAELKANTERLDVLNELISKYRVASLEELIIKKQELASEVADTENIDEDIEQLEKEVKDCSQKLLASAKELRSERKKAAQKLEKEILAALPFLNISSAQLNFTFSDLPQPDESGMDEVEIMASLNPGSPVAPLIRIASGGELSRIMLALKFAIGKKLNLPTMIFDEIDTGLGGETASKMGQLLKEMAHSTQLISITHLAQIAAKGAHHLRVVKESDQQVTQTIIEELPASERLNEVARMISGEHITPEALANAKVLLN
ncbi:DNA repair protein RecN [Luteibaculum oceani]|uniref:DNA repair protein RecN n=1 Tax=Luteibaculum oceani TaxID=1294296 RepID=A0A5C6UT53_9FLAO|nr:DNA repair protein RecN [Luteibaculum oceani]TXC76149.1 DNA repair protein RecN [Luteibaculum oceani]